ncbi:hypothetical protein [Streptomyces sp. NPDC058382]|uniref:hypothetical protein n=1 Tax=unclassified Streptomyces TaxID=2593676 RepID=UPI0036278B84
MTAARDPAVLYPDIATEGSLAAALQAAADRDGLAVSFEASESSPLLRASVTSVVSHRTVLTISAWEVKRRWSICGREPFQDVSLVEGITQDLAQVARASQAWQNGVELAGRARPGRA